MVRSLGLQHDLSWGGHLTSLRWSEYNIIVISEVIVVIVKVITVISEVVMVIVEVVAVTI